MITGSIYVGIDLHKHKFDFVMLDDSGVLLSQGSRRTDVGAIADFAVQLGSRHQVVLEPLQNSLWFLDHIRPYAGSVHVANPGKVRLIAESRLKNDRIDARILADLLRVGYLPEVYIPDDKVRQWRCLVSHRIRLVRDSTRLKNRILGLINREGFCIAASDPFGKQGRGEFDSLGLSPLLRQMVESNLTTLGLYTSQVAALDKEIKEIVESDETARLLCTIDGVGCFTALAIKAAVGDMRRFRSARAFAAYTGLIPGYRQSGDKVRNGSITKQGNSTLRWLLIQAVTHAIRRSDYLKRLYHRICFRSSVGKARVAVAHALARIIYQVWTEARPYYR